MATQSIREQIMQVVLATVRPAATQLGAEVHRSPSVAIAREKLPSTPGIS